MRRFFKRTKKNYVGSDPTSIGNLLVVLGHCTMDDIYAAVESQHKNPDVLLGAHLLDLGVINETVLNETIAKQKALRSGKADEVREFAKVAADKAMTTSTAVHDVLGNFLDKVK